MEGYFPAAAVIKEVMIRLLLAAVAATLSLSVAAQTKRAFVVGLGRQQDASWAKINGDRDAELMTSLLRERRYSDLTTLVNEQATKAAITDGLARLARRCRRGDRVLVHFSGHGQQMTDLDGDERDGWDECWIPYDAFQSYGPSDRGERHLSDDELNTLLTAIRQHIGSSGRLLVVVDACHSGDSTRGDASEIVRGSADHFVLPGAGARKFRGERRERWITLSACLDYQRNSEVMTCGGSYGRLTYALRTIMLGTVPQDNAQLLRRIRQFFNEHRANLPQTPTLTGETEKWSVAQMLENQRGGVK